jgi:hypothetical protein
VRKQGDGLAILMPPTSSPALAAFHGAHIKAILPQA